MKLTEIFKKNQYSLSFEVFPPKTSDLFDGVKAAMIRLKEIDDEGFALLGEEYYCYALGRTNAAKTTRSNVPFFITQVTKTFELEVAEIERLERKGLTDYVVAGGFNERHNMKKEINFSSSHTFDDGICRLAGSSRGKKWSVVKAHGWFSYDLKVKPNAENTITVTAKGWDSDHVDLSVTVGDEKTVFRKIADGKVECAVKYNETKGDDKVTVRFDRITEFAPVVYTVEVE